MSYNCKLVGFDSNDLKTKIIALLRYATEYVAYRKEDMEQHVFEGQELSDIMLICEFFGELLGKRVGPHKASDYLELIAACGKKYMDGNLESVSAESLKTAISVLIAI